MALKSSNNGPFTLPALPAVGTTVTQSASANTYGSYVQMTASTGEADYIIGVVVSNAAFSTSVVVPNYIALAIGTGAAASESLVATGIISPYGTTTGSGSTFNVGGVCMFPVPIPIAASTRIAIKAASDVATAFQWKVTLLMMKQVDVIDAGINESADAKAINAVSTSSVTTVKAVQGLTTADTITTYTGDTPQTGDSFARIGAAGAGLTALGDARIANLDAAVSSRMETFTLPTNFSLLAISAAGFASSDVQLWKGNVPSGLSGGDLQVKIIAGTFVTATFGTCDLTATMKASVTTAATAATPTINATQAFSNTGTWTGNLSGSVGSVVSFGTLVADIAVAVWGAAVRLLTAGTNIALAKGTGVTGFNDLSAAQVNSECDTALADYDGPTNAEMEARTIVAASYATAANQTTINSNVVAIPAAITSDHGSGSYVRNTEPPTVGQIGTQVTSDHGAGNYQTATGFAVPGSQMTLDLTQAYTPTDNTETLGGALAAARAQGFGKWALVGTTLTLYAADGTTAVRAFTLDSATAPTSRT